MSQCQEFFSSSPRYQLRQSTAPPRKYPHCLGRACGLLCVAKLTWQDLDNEESVVMEYLKRHNLLAGSFQHCGQNMILEFERKIYRCLSCKTTRGLRSGSFFENSKLVFNLMIKLLWRVLVCKVSLGQISQDINVSHKTVTRFISHLGEKIQAYNKKKFEKDEKSCTTLSSDETHFGRNKYNRGKKQRLQPLIYLMSCRIENENKKQKVAYIYGDLVQNKKEENLLQHALHLCGTGAKFITDEHRSYKSIRKFRPDVHHETVCHKREFKNSETNVHTNCIESVNSAVKRMIKICFGRLDATGGNKMSIAIFKCNYKEMALKIFLGFVRFEPDTASATIGPFCSPSMPDSPSAAIGPCWSPSICPTVLTQYGEG